MFWQQIVNGATVGSSYALVAVGFTMVFGVLRLINLANGSIFLLGGYLTLMFYQAMRLNQNRFRVFCLTNEIDHGRGIKGAVFQAHSRFMNFKVAPNGPAIG